MTHTVITAAVQCQPDGFECQTGKLAVHLVRCRPLCAQHSPYDVAPPTVAPPTVAPMVVPAPPTVAPATPRPRRRHGFRNFMIGTALIAGGFFGIGQCSVDPTPPAYGSVSACYTNQGIGPEKTCRWDDEVQGDGTGQSFMSYNYGLKIVNDR